MDTRKRSFTSSTEDVSELTNSQQEEIQAWKAREERFRQVSDEEDSAISREVSDRIFNLVRNHGFDKVTWEDPSPEVFMAVLRKERGDAFYLGIAHRVAKGEKVTAEEYLYYALTTRNVMTLDLDTLKAARRICDYQNYRPNLDILSTILEWHQEKDPEAKRELNENFLMRLRYRRRGEDGCDGLRGRLFLNLAGVDLRGAQLNNAEFECVDMGGADFGRANFNHVRFVRANINNADFRGLECQDSDAVLFANSTARYVRFDGVMIHTFSAGETDFTQSSFQNARLGSAYGYYENAKFDGADLQNARLHFRGGPGTSVCSFKDADLRNANLKGAVRYDQYDFTDAKLFSFYPGSYCIRDKLDKALKHLNSVWQKDDYRKLVAQYIIDCCEVEEDEGKVLDALHAAIEHPIFRIQNTAKQLMNVVQRSAYSLGSTLFNLGPHHAFYPTTALAMLERKRDELMASRPGEDISVRP